ncbi:hypothetical protein DPMN_079906 [Dreissena polymorpha]|uniref:Uncharacterized protein n=1 Tax=Dreissena polymorpha TaxID=45954 RepID=A0A9D3YTG3_DREPO|nr:hypothetical protein DPMN_079906 [Dreissena polymorpha]
MVTHQEAENTCRDCGSIPLFEYFSPQPGIRLKANGAQRSFDPHLPLDEGDTFCVSERAFQ